jgi:ABC-2 type transport system ATP-binding protein
MSQTALLSVSDLSFSHGDRPVLRDINLDIVPGEIVGLLGPNGSGKSTLLSILGGLLPNQAGSISYAGSELKTPHRMFRQELAFVFQSPSLDGKLTAMENLMLAGRMRGFSGQGRP